MRQYGAPPPHLEKHARRTILATRINTNTTICSPSRSRHLDSPTTTKSILTKFIQQMILPLRLCRFRIALLLPTICMWFLERQSGLISVTTVQGHDDALPLPESPTIAQAIHSLHVSSNEDSSRASPNDHPKEKHLYQQQSLPIPPVNQLLVETNALLLNNEIERIPSEQTEWEHRRNTVDYLKQVFPGPPIVDHNTTSSCQGQRVLEEIQIHVITWKRSTELASLLKTLQTADYTGYNQNLPLYIHVDGDGLKEVKKQARSFKWKYGTKHVDIRPSNIGLREMWLRSLRQAAKGKNNALMLVLEDDMVLSPFYFQWLLKMVDHYARNPDCRDANLVGFSLSPIIRQNMYKPFYGWNADQELGPHLRQLRSQERHSVYLSSVPSSWGGAFWSDVWNQFDSFVQERVKPPFYNISAEDDTKATPSSITPEILQLPHDCTTRKWTKSWKRFLVDFMYGRGMWMLYPNLRDNLGLAYAMQTTGTHVNRFNKDRYKVDLVEDLSILTEMEAGLPSYEELLLVDLEHYLSSKEIVTAQGTLFLNRIAKECKSCQNLVTKWARPGWNVPSNGYDHFPLICAADLHAPVSTNALRPTSHVGDDMEDRYLVITSNMVNPQDANVWAALLNRRLILPAGANPTSPTDPNGSNLLADWLTHYASLPVVTYPNSKNMSPLFLDDSNPMNNTLPWRQLVLTSPLATTKDMKVPEIDLRHLFSQAKSLPVATMQHLLGGCSDKVLTLNGLPALDFASSTNLTVELLHEKVKGVKAEKGGKRKGGRINVKRLKERLHNTKMTDRNWSSLGARGEKKVRKRS